MIILVDFDGTVVECDFPNIGKEQKNAIQTLKWLQNQGHKLILWTCREDHISDKSCQYLTNAIDWCLQRGIIFDSINQPIECSYFPRQDYKYKRKPFAHLHLDDRNLGGFPGWDVVRKHVEENLEELENK